MKKNKLKTFYEFMGNHRNFYVNVIADKVLSNTEQNNNKDDNLEMGNAISITCNGLSFDELKEKIEVVTTNAMKYMQSVGNEYGHKCSILLEPDVKIIKTLLKDPFKEGKTGIEVKIWVDKRLRANPFSPSDYVRKVIDMHMKLQMEKINLVLKEYDKLITQFQILIMQYKN